MRTMARARFVRVSPRKARLVLRELVGKPVGEALALLQHTRRAAARLVEKTLRSAIANAEHNHQVRSLDDLRIVEAVADGGPTLKRIQPRAMGRAFHIRHRTSHLTLVLSDERAPRAHAPAPPAQASDAAGADARGPGRRTRAGEHRSRRAPEG